MVLALFFITGSWIWFLVGAGISAILGALMRPLLTFSRAVQADLDHLTPFLEGGKIKT
jgi:hypothetical protein